MNKGELKIQGVGILMLLGRVEAFLSISVQENDKITVLFRKTH